MNTRNSDAALIDAALAKEHNQRVDEARRAAREEARAAAATEAVHAVALTFVFHPTVGASGEAVFYVADCDLWSAEGLARVFHATRNSFLVHPERPGFDEDSWESWHLTAIQQIDGFIIQPRTPPE
jgi:hypothetical protein